MVMVKQKDWWKINDMIDKTKYKIIEWEDETSMFDPRGRWVGGSDYYSVTCKAYVPIELENEDEIYEYIENHTPECYVDYNGK